jgi:predicted transcriptional regulator
MQPEPPSIGDNELALLRWLAGRLDGATVGEASAAIGVERGWARTTVLTMMERLRSKGLLDRKQADGVFRYHTVSSPAEIERGAVESFVQRTLGGSFRPLVAYLAEEAEVSADELAELEALVATLQARHAGKDEP